MTAHRCRLGGAVVAVVGQGSLSSSIVVPESERPGRLQRLRDRFGRRTAGLVLTLLVEALLLLLLLTLGPGAPPDRTDEVPILTYDVTPDAVPEASPDAAPEPPQAAEPERATAEPETQPPTPPEPVAPPSEQTPPPPPVRPVAPTEPAPYIRLNRDQMAQADVARPTAPPRAPAGPPSRPRGVAGPPNVPRASAWADTERVGTGPQGQPLYAAAWYREPYDDELSGYLSTAQGPGYGLIACRTVREYRVEDCVAMSESPDRSGIARAVLAAAWQFRVRPPRLGGEQRYGEWVRIRIDYGTARPKPKWIKD